MARLANIMRNPFSFLFTRSSAEEQVVAYLTREHRRGRRLTEILQDRYVQNRLTPEQQARLLDRPEVVRALGEQDVDAAREHLGR
jgi:hemerythrin-like domain-containing protein